MDLNFFLDFEELLNEYNSEGEVLKLTDEQKDTIKKTEFDYELFRYDFDMTCRFIYLLSRLDRFKYSATYVILLKYVMVISTFLRNNTTTRLSPENEAYLIKATDSLVADFRINLQILPENVSDKMYDTAKIFIAFAIVNIYEVVGVTRASPRNAPVFFFLCNEADLVYSESSLITFASGMSDFKYVGKALDETVDSSAFKKYSQQPRPNYKKSFENQKLLIYGSILLLLLVILIAASELTLRYFN